MVFLAERRMFAKSVINSARFLRMPQTSRLLYFDLGMAADDDGVVEAFTVLRTTGAAEDDLRVLASKGFVTILNDDLVTHISDWSRNNYIQKDRYHPSIYADLLGKSEGNMPCIQPVYKLDTEVRLGEDRLGKDRQDKESPGQARAGEAIEPPPPPPGRAEEYFRQRIDPAPSASSMEKLREFEVDLSPEVCIRAIDEAVNAGKRSWNYVAAILLRKQEQGIRSLEDWDRAEAQRMAGKTTANEENGNGSRGPSDLGDNEQVFRELGIFPASGRGG